MSKSNIFLQIIIGFMLADFVAGFFHWFEDNYLDYCVDFPLLKQIAKDNELQHYFPRTVVAHSFLENISKTLPLVLLFLIALYVLNCYHTNIIKNYSYFLISFILFASTANVFHKYSHMRDCERNSIITTLQKTGILCSHEHHKVHHMSTDKRYCVISEYSNHILDSIHFWKILENIIYFTTSIKVTRKTNYDEYSEIQNHMHIGALLECPKKPTKQDIALLKEILRKYKKCKK